jgi:branched-chain amino acid transport system substrate-binding protein
LQFISVLRANGYSQPVVGGDGYDAQDIWQQDTSLTDIYYSTHAYFGGDHPSPAVAAFRSAYMAEYNVAPGSFAGLGYDTAGLLAAVIDKAGSAAPSALLDALSTLTDFDGVTGNISFINGSRVPLKSVTILEVADGKRRFVEEIVPKHVADP